MRYLILLVALFLVAPATSADFRPLIMGADGKTRQFPDGTDQLRVVPIAGLDASKPAAAVGNTGLLYLATDTLRIYRSTGSTWAHLTNGAGLLGSANTWSQNNTFSAVNPSVSLGINGAVSGGLKVWSATNNAEGNIYSDATYGLRMDTNSNARPIRLDGSQIQLGPGGSEVLIGTTTDAGDYRLQVAGSGALGMTVRNANSDYAVLYEGYNGSSNGFLTLIQGGSASASVPAWQNAGILEYNRTGSGDLHISSYAGDILFDTNARTQRMRLKADGEFLIGTATDAGAYKLQVAGAVLTTGEIVAPAATTSIPSIRLPHGTAPTTPTNGDMWTTTAGAYARINGSTVSLAGAPATPSVVAYFTGNGGSTVSATTAETSIFLGFTTSRGSLTIPANTLVSGSVLRIKAAGPIGAVSAPTFRLRVKVGASTVLDSGAVVLDAGNHNSSFDLECLMAVETAGASAAALGNVNMQYMAGSGTIVGALKSLLSNSSATVNTTVGNAVSVTVQWGTSNANNTISCYATSVEILTP